MKKIQGVVIGVAPLAAAAYIFGLLPHSNSVKYGVAALQVGAFMWGGVPTMQYAFATASRTAGAAG